MSQKINRNQSDNVTISTTVSMGYGTTAVVTRCGNLVTVNMNTVTNSMAAGDTLALGEIFPSGYRPIGGIYGSVVAVTTVGSNRGLGWNVVAGTGAMQLSNNVAITGATRISGYGAWFTTDAWPA